MHLVESKYRYCNGCKNYTNDDKFFDIYPQEDHPGGQVVMTYCEKCLQDLYVAVQRQMVALGYVPDYRGQS